MKIECLKEKLREAVGLAERVSTRHATMPILGAVVLVAEGDSLVVKSTNLEVGLEAMLPAKVIEPGEVAVPAGAFAALLANLPKLEKISLNLAGGNLQIKTNFGLTTLKSFPTEDFPVIPRSNGKDKILVPAHELAAGLRSVLYSASISSLKPEIASVYFYLAGTRLVLVATDSFRLAEKKVVVGKGAMAAPAIVPLRNGSEILRLVDGLTDQVELTFAKNQLTVVVGERRLTSTLIDGVFPDYQQIMPSKFLTEVVIDREELAQALRLTQIFSDRFSQIDLAIKAKENKLILKSANQEVGANELVLQPSIKGEDLEISFNVKHLLEAFPSIAAETVTLQFNERNRPLLLSGLGDQTFRYIVMPINR